ncbi:putative DBH-like monooxygenase protein 2 isoform X1 [Pyxicephalus adspersus]|uniref:putative DBH-like monooxygenase protein 2 isoform X1 n=1 Tax=Pyxicephalus adspersus TaxID=30357 RepID=UPI003B596B34
MLWNVWMLFFWVVPILGSRGTIDLPHSREVISSENENVLLFKWGYDREMQEISIEIQVPAVNWLALGFSPDGKLETSDLAIGGWDKDDKLFFYDGHIEGVWPPVPDKSQDYELLELSRNKTHTVLRIWRKWFTCDSNDLDIENDTVRVIIIFGEDYKFTLLEENIYRKSFFFLEILNDDIEPEIVIPYEFRLHNFPIPVHDTTYACTFIPMPNVSTKHHIIRYEPINDPNGIGIVHHILIYGCGNNLKFSSEIGDCYGNDPRYAKCMNSMFGWAIGGEVFDFPPDMGVPIGTEEDPKYIRIEIHYSNFENKPGILDSSGIRIYYTPQLREHDGGILMTGIFTFPAHFVPPGAERFRSYGHCNTHLIPKILGHPVEDFHVNTYLLHGHLTVRSIRVMHYRNGTLIGSLGEDKNYDFNFQQVRGLPGIVTVKMGDQILVECSSSTQDRDGVTFGGPSTLNEMCVAFLFYYPVVPIAACWSLVDLQYVNDALELEETETIMDAIININSVDWDEETIAKAQTAVQEAKHTAIINHRTGDMINETSPALPISLPTPFPCHKCTEV